MNLAEVVSRFENPHRVGAGYMVRCPCHDDKKNSLSVNEGRDGKIVLKCMAGCSSDAVIEAVGLTYRDLAGTANGAQPKNDPVIERYVYTDENRKPLFRACRTRSKDFFQERFDAVSRQFIGGKGCMDGMRRVLYRLPEVIAAESVFIVEGEKDADKVASIGLTATTNVGGAGKWQPSYSESLKGKDLVIFPDNDEPGQNHAITVAKAVLLVAKSVRVVSLPDLPPKGDISDYLQSHTKEDLLALVDTAPLFVGNTDSKGQGNLYPEFLTAREILQAPKDPTRWIVQDCLPVGGASVLVGKPKVAKTTLAADLSLSVARGEPWLGRATQQSPVAYVFLDGPLTDIAETFVKLGLRETDPVFIHAGSAPVDAVDWILAAVREKRARLVVIDTIQKLCRFENINDYSEVTMKMEPLLEAARDGNCHVMTLHHAKKDSHDDLDAAIGSTAIRGLCYTYIFVKRLSQSTRRIISSDQRGGKNFEETGFSFDKATGRLKIDGTLLEVEINDAEPTILEFFETHEEGATEKEIGQALDKRALIISRALRKLFKEGRVERTGKGVRGNAFRYSLAASIFDENATVNTPSYVTTSFSSSSRKTESTSNGATEAGRESQNATQSKENKDEMLFPENREEIGRRNGRETEENNEKTTPGRESAGCTVADVLRIFPGARVVQ